MSKRNRTRLAAAKPEAVPAVVAQRAPHVGRIVAPRNQAALSTRSLNAVTPSRVASALRDLDAGRYELWADLCTQAKRDPVVRRAYTIRRAAIAGRPYSVEVPEGVAPDMRQAAEDLAEITRKFLANIDGLETFLMRVLDGIGVGLSVHELVWGRADGLWLPQPAQVLTREARYDDDWTLSVRDKDYNWVRTAEHPGKFLTHVPWTEQGRPQDQGDFQAAIFYWLFKLKSWIARLSGAERFGNPFLLARMAAESDLAQRTAMLADLQQFTQDSAAVTTGDSTIEVVQAAAAGSSDFYATIRKDLNEEIFLALGVSPDLVLSGVNGSMAADRVKDGVRLESSKMDARLAWGDIVRDVAPWLSYYNLRRTDIPLPVVVTQFDDSVPVTPDTIAVGGATVNEVRAGNGLPAWSIAQGGERIAMMPAAAVAPGFAVEEPAAVPFPRAPHGLPTLTHTRTTPTSSASPTSPRPYARVPSSGAQRS